MSITKSQKRTRTIRDDSDDEYQVSSSTQRVKTDPGYTNWDAEVHERNFFEFICSFIETEKEKLQWIKGILKKMFN